MLAVYRQVPCIHVTLGLFRDCFSVPVKSIVLTKSASHMPTNLEPIWRDCLFGWPQADTCQAWLTILVLLILKNVEWTQPVPYDTDSLDLFGEAVSLGAMQGSNRGPIFGETVSLQGRWLHTGRCHTRLPVPNFGPILENLAL
jgi:hypothetical protein